MAYDDDLPLNMKLQWGHACGFAHLGTANSEHARGLSDLNAPGHPAQ
jgi:hypothetical protein